MRGSLALEQARQQRRDVDRLARRRRQRAEPRERLDHGLDAPRVRLDALGELAAELRVVEAARQHRGVGADADERVADLVRDGGGEAAEAASSGFGPGSVCVGRDGRSSRVAGATAACGLRSPPARCGARAPGRRLRLQGSRLRAWPRGHGSSVEVRARGSGDRDARRGGPRRGSDRRRVAVSVRRGRLRVRGGCRATDGREARERVSARSGARVRRAPR